MDNFTYLENKTTKVCIEKGELVNFIIDGVEYMNDGDWVESRTALVEHYDGKWEIIQYKD